MPRIVDYYFAPGSPWTYFGHALFQQLLAKHGAQVNVKPVDLGRVFSVSGGLPLKQRAPQRQAYRLVELARFRDHLGVPLNLQPKFFPFANDPASLAIIAAADKYGSAAAMNVALGIMRGCWAEERDMASAEALAAVAREQGLDPAALTGDAAVAAAKVKYEANTQEAIDRGVFGAPSYVLDGVIFWGQDRLDFVDRALAR